MELNCPEKLVTHEGSFVANKCTVNGANTINAGVEKRLFFTVKHLKDRSTVFKLTFSMIRITLNWSGPSVL